MTYILDTNICIHIIRSKNKNVIERFKTELYSGLCISAITLAELEYGVRHSSNPARNETALIRFLSPLDILPFDRDAAWEYGNIRDSLVRRGIPIGSLDMLIAACAKAYDLILVTNNTREFERVSDLKLEDWA